MPLIGWRLHQTIGIFISCKGFWWKVYVYYQMHGWLQFPSGPLAYGVGLFPKQQFELVTKFSEVQSYLPFCSLDHGWRLSQLVVNMFFLSDSFWFCTALRFYNLLLGSQSSHEGILSIDGCNSYCWGRESCEGFLIWPFFWHHSEYFLFRSSVKYMHCKYLLPVYSLLS